MNRPLNRYIDHTLLRADATEADIRKLIDEAIRYDFAAVCVNGCHVRTAAELLTDTSINVAAVVGFPLGAAATYAKVEEARIAIEDGAREIDMVMNIGAAKSDRWDLVRNEIYNLAQICHRSSDEPVLLKVIIETCLLTDEEILRACRISQLACADYVKTSTGFSDGGAMIHHVRLMKEALGDFPKVKASGGIRTLSDAKAMIEAGADRLGCSASVAIMQEAGTNGSGL